jgi:hypothetical protein
VLKENYNKKKTIKWIEAQYAKMDALAAEGNLMIDGKRVPKNVGDKVELYDFEKGEIAKKGIGVGSDGEVYISKEALEYFKKGEKGGESGLKKGEKGLGNSSKEGIKKKGANDNIIKPYTGPNTGYKSKVDVDFAGDIINIKTQANNYAKITLENLAYIEKGELAHISELQKVSLAKALEAQALEKGIIGAGKGSNKVFRDAVYKAKNYGGNPEDYVKMYSEGYYRVTDTLKVQTHWVENTKTGVRYEMKVKFYEIKSGAGNVKDR